MKSNAPYILTLVSENVSIVMTFALSRSALKSFRDKLTSDFYPLERLLGAIPEERADRALLEAAYLLRSLDDAEKIGHSFPESFGTLHHKDGRERALTFRDAVNKIIHANRYVWHADNLAAVQVECVGEDVEKWVSAYIDLVVLASAIGRETQRGV